MGLGPGRGHWSKGELVPPGPTSGVAWAQGGFPRTLGTSHYSCLIDNSPCTIKGAFMVAYHFFL